MEPDNKIPFNFGSAATGFTKSEREKMPELSLASYMKLVEPLAQETEHETGIYYLVPIIQSAHESRAGNSGLAKEHGNLFGIVATDSWKNAGRPIAYMPTWEVITTKKPIEIFYPKAEEKNSIYHKPPEILEKWADKADGATVHKIKIYPHREFRAYPTWRDSFFDWGRLISTLRVYRDAYEKLKNKDTVRDGINLMAGTYATDPRYARSLLILWDKLNGQG